MKVIQVNSNSNNQAKREQKIPIVIIKFDFIHEQEYIQNDIAVCQQFTKNETDGKLNADKIV